MLELTITSARQSNASDIAATVDCLTDITTDFIHSKAPCPLYLLQCRSVLTFRREVFQAKLLAVVKSHQRERS